MKFKLYIFLLLYIFPITNSYSNDEVPTKSFKSIFEKFRDEKDRLVREDNRLYSSLVQNCNKPVLPCSVYSGDSFNRDILRLKRDIHKLNANQQYINSFSILESKAIAWVTVTHEITDFNLIPKSNADTQKPWDHLPTRDNNDSSIIVGSDKKAEKSGFIDPYANVSNELSQNKINEEAESYANSINTLIAITEAVATAYTKTEDIASASGGVLANSSDFSPGNANHCMNFIPYNRGRFTIENTCPFNIQTYRCESTERLGLSCITTMPIRSNHHNAGHPYSNQVNGTPVKFGACRGNCDPGGSFYIEDGKSPDCECKPSSGTIGTAR